MRCKDWHIRRFMVVGALCLPLMVAPLSRIAYAEELDAPAAEQQTQDDQQLTDGEGDQQPASGENDSQAGGVVGEATDDNVVAGDSTVGEEADSEENGIAIAPAEGTSADQPQSDDASQNDDIPQNIDESQPSGAQEESDPQVSPQNEGNSSSEDGQPATEPVEGADETDSGPVADGTYVISSGAGAKQVLGTKGNEKKAGITAIATGYSSKKGVRWILTYDKSFDAYIVSLASSKGKMVLEVKGAAKNGAVVQINNLKEAGSARQRWIVTKFGSGWRFASKLAENLVLSIKGGKATEGASMELAEKANLKTQRFSLYNTAAAPSRGKTLTDGLYKVIPLKDKKLALAIEDGSLTAGANAMLAKQGKERAQRFYFSYGKDGYYTITNLASGKVLEVADGSPIPGAEVQQAKPNGKSRQKWTIELSEDGAYRIVNKASRLVLAVKGAKFAKGTNVLGAKSSASAAQAMTLKSTEFLDAGIYEVKPLANAKMSLGIHKGSGTSGASLRVQKDGNKVTQRFEIVRVGKNVYRIRTGASGGWLSDVKGNGKPVTQEGSSKTESEAQIWKVVWNGTYFSLQNESTGRVMNLAKGSTKVNNFVRVRRLDATQAQHFLYEVANLVEPGWYALKAGTGKMLAAREGGGSGANVRTKANNGTWAQRFYITAKGKDVTIREAVSGKYVRATGSKGGSNVELGAAQKWHPIIVDGGGIAFVDNATNLVLAVRGSSEKEGANVVLSRSVDSAGACWKLTSSNPTSGNKDLDSALDAIVKNVTGTGIYALRNAYVYTSRFSYAFQNKWPGGSWKSWSVPYALSMYRNRAGNCYRYASLLCWIARRLGYDARTVSGSVLLSYGTAAHGWVEVKMDGVTYTVDPDLYHEYPTHDFFMRPYGNTAVRYIL